MCTLTSDTAAFSSLPLPPSLPPYLVVFGEDEGPVADLVRKPGQHPRGGGGGGGEGRGEGGGGGGRDRV